MTAGASIREKQAVRSAIGPHLLRRPGPRRGRPLAAATLAWALLHTGCGADGPEHVPASAPPPGGAAADSAAPAIERTLRVAVDLDAQYALVADARSRAATRVARASAVLEREAGLALRLVRLGMIELPPSEARAERLLDHLERQSAPDDADLHLVLAAVGAPAPERSEYVQSRYAGRTIFARSLAPFFDPGETDSLEAADAALIVEGVASIFGAMPFCGDAAMDDSLPPRVPEPFLSATNRGLVRLHQAFSFTAPGGARPTPEQARAALRLFEQASGARRCDPRAFEARARVLLAVLAPPPAAAPTAPPLPPAPSGETPEAAYTRCAELAERWPTGEAARCAGLAAVATGRSTDGIRFLRVWMAGHDDDSEAVLALARAVGRGGDDGAARGVLVDHVSRHPESAEVWMNLGIAEARLGQIEAARKAWQTVLRLRPGQPDAKALLHQLPPSR